MALVLAYARMMPRIEAGERLGAISDHTLAAGNMERGDRLGHIRRLREQQRGERVRAAKANAAVLAHMGIAVKTVSPAAQKPLASPSGEGDG